MFFSIICVSFNAEDLIRATLNTVLEQTFSDFEIIVKDGMSKDKTLDEIPLDKRIKVYSSKDGGIYNAMNEAVTYASGKYLLFLNCGDKLVNSNVLQTVYDQIIEDKNEDNLCIYYGNYLRKDVETVQPVAISKFSLYRSPLNHQSMFFSHRVFSEISFYDDTMKVCADYYLTVKAYNCGVKFKHVDCLIDFYQGQGFSESKKNKKISKMERRKILKDNFTLFERFKYGSLMFLTLRPLRIAIASDEAPAWLRKGYKKIVNKVNGAKSKD